jgi:uncharacterized phage protein (TIGR01671 family)
VHHFIIPIGTDLSKERAIDDIQVEVIPNTICEYTGLSDENWKRIFEGDIITVIGYKEHPIGRISFKNAQWVVDGKDFENMRFRNDLYFWAMNRPIEIVGNVFDNPEMEA